MKVLVFAPHRDDEILGVGGTILKRKAAGDHVTVCLVTAREGQELPEKTKIIHQEMKNAHAYCGIDEYIGMPFYANYLENFSRVEFNTAFYNVIMKVRPDEIYIPFWGDMQKDHRMTADAVMVASRAKHDNHVKRIYAYETLSETGINVPTPENTFIPNVFEDISDYIDGKLEAMSFFKTQVHPFPDLRSLEAIESLAKFRGATVNVKAAEAFMLVREIK